MDDLEFNTEQNRNVPDNITLKEIHKWYIIRIAALIILNSILFLIIVKPFPNMVQTILVSNLVSFNIAGLIIGTIVACFPYKSLTYGKRYLRASLISIFGIQSLITVALLINAAMPLLGWNSSEIEVKNHQLTPKDFPMFDWTDSLHFDIKDFEHVYYGEIDTLMNYAVLGLNNLGEDSMSTMLFTRNQSLQRGFGGKIFNTDSCQCYQGIRGNKMLIFKPLNRNLDSFLFTFQLGKDRSLDPVGPMIMRKYLPKHLPNTQQVLNFPIHE